MSDVNAVHTVGSIEMGGEATGRVETWAQREPRLLREEVEMEGVRMVVTIAGDDAWLTDNNGAVRSLSGAERASALLTHELLFHDYLDGETPPFALTVEEQRIRFVPPDGSSEPVLELATDASTGAFLPVSWTERQQGMTVVTRFTDWRTVDGVRIPYTSTQSTGDPRFDLVRRTDTLILLEALGEGAVPIPEVGRHVDAFVTDPELARAIPIELMQNLVVVDVSVDGETGRFLLDTGAGSTIVSRAFAERLGLAEKGRIEARGAGGNETAAFVEVGSLTVPGIELRDQTLVTLPLDALAGALERPIDGILGYDFLSRFTVEIDYVEKRLALGEPGGYVPREGAVRVPLTIEANIPRIPGRVGDLPAGLFILDTGNSRSVFLHGPFVKKHALGDLLETVASRVSGIGGHQEILEARVPSLTVGDVPFTDVPVAYSTADSGVLAIDEAIGNLGGALFAHGVLAVDYSEGSLWFSPMPTAERASRR